MRTLIVLLLTAVLILPASCAAAQPRPREADTPVEYAVVLHDAHTQMVGVAMSLRGVRPGELEIALPVWRPGKYVLIEPVTTLRDLAARTSAGAPLQLTKTDKSSWTISIPDAASADEVLISYRIHANSIADRTRHADDTHAFLSPSTVFLYAPAFRDRPLAVRIDAPDNWQIATGLEPDAADPTLLRAANYDALVDSPLEIGLHERLTFHLDGTPHEIIIWNPTSKRRTLPDDRITGDFQKIVRAQRDLFGSLPYRRYVSLIHAYPGGRGGTEHLNSTIMQTSPEALRDEDPYKKFLGLVSHEFFHTWNVKQFRPAGLVPYDYQRENYTTMLWLVEGATSYYDDLILARAGLVNPDDYLKTLSTAIDTLRRRPGADVQSLAESSFDAWVKFNKTWPDSVNSTVSFYDKGALASFLLDLEIRRASANEHTLDDLMRDLYQRFPPDGPGYTYADVVASASRLAGADLSPFFDRFITGRDPLPFEDAVSLAGLELLRTGGKDDPRPYLGLGLEVRENLATVSSVLADGPAHAAGILPGDSLLAANAQRIRSQADLDALLKTIKPGDELTLSLFRYDALREFSLRAAAQPDGRWTLRRIETPTAEQKRTYRSWLGQPWPGEDDPNPARPRRRNRKSD